MKKSFLICLLSLCLTSVLAGCGDDDHNGGQSPADNASQLTAQPVKKSNPMVIFTHYMAWFSAPETSGAWNHWTMSDQALKADNYASWYTPLQGPYASTDEDNLDYQMLLMKYSGIDGVAVDWYGSSSRNDYGFVDQCTQLVMKAARKAGLKLALCYEDQSLNDDGTMPAQARTDINYAYTHYFISPAYYKIDGAPLLLCFGPQKLVQPADWSTAFGGLPTQPVFLALNGRSGIANDDGHYNCQGEFGWVDGQPDYSRAASFRYFMGGAMPGFHDHYEASGQGDGYTTYDHQDGALLQAQLQAAREANLKYLQLITWNDYGEGTMIEPTKEFGFKFLSLVQQFAGVGYTQDVLQLIFRWYQLKKRYKGQTEKISRLDSAYHYFIALQPDKAKAILDNIDR